MVRLGYGISQEELALKADLDRTYVSGIERGRRNLGLENLCRLAHALEVSPETLLEGVPGLEALAPINEGPVAGEKLVGGELLEFGEVSVLLILVRCHDDPPNGRGVHPE